MKAERASFRGLVAWQRAMDLVTAIYRVSAAFPKEECYGLTAQIRRAAVSIPSNIAEGYGRSGAKDYLKFLTIARGSLREVETQLELAVRLGFITEVDHNTILPLSDEVGRTMQGLISSIGSTVSSSSNE